MWVPYLGEYYLPHYLWILMSYLSNSEFCFYAGDCKLEVIVNKRPIIIFVWKPSKSSAKSGGQVRICKMGHCKAAGWNWAPSSKLYWTEAWAVIVINSKIIYRSILCMFVYSKMCVENVIHNCTGRKTSSVGSFSVSALSKRTAISKERDSVHFIWAYFELRKVTMEPHNRDARMNWNAKFISQDVENTRRRWFWLGIL